MFDKDVTPLLRVTHHETKTPLGAQYCKDAGEQRRSRSLRQAGGTQSKLLPLTQPKATQGVHEVYGTYQ